MNGSGWGFLNLADERPFLHRERNSVFVWKKLQNRFETGKLYEEKEVNEIIRRFHEDVCTIPRDMISEHIMEREGSIYKLK